MTEFQYGDDEPIDPAFTSSTGNFNRDFYTEDQFDKMEVNGTQVDVDIFWIAAGADMIKLLSELDDLAVLNEAEGVIELSLLN